MGYIQRQAEKAESRAERCGEMRVRCEQPGGCALENGAARRIRVRCKPSVRATVALLTLRNGGGSYEHSV